MKRALTCIALPAFLVLSGDSVFTTPNSETCEYKPFKKNKGRRLHLLKSLRSPGRTGGVVRREIRKEIEKREGPSPAPAMDPKTDLLLSLAKWCTFAVRGPRIIPTKECGRVTGTFMLHGLDVGVNCLRGQCTLLAPERRRIKNGCHNAFFLSPVFKTGGYYRNNGAPIPSNPSNRPSPEIYRIELLYDSLDVFMRLTNLGRHKQREPAMFSRTKNPREAQYHIRILSGGLIREVSTPRFRQIFYYNKQAFRRAVRAALNDPKPDRETIIVFDPRGKREILRLRRG